MVKKLLIVGDIIFFITILFMQYACYKNITDYRIAFAIAPLIIGILISAIPSSMNELGLLSNSGKYNNVDLVLKLLIIIQIVYLSNFNHYVTMALCLCEIIICIACKLKICEEIEEKNVSTNELIRELRAYDSSYIDCYYSFIVCNFVLILIFMSVHETFLELIISGLICTLYFSIGMIRIWKNKSVGKKDIYVLFIIEIIILVLVVLDQRLLVYIFLGEFYSYLRNALKRRLENVCEKEN